MHDNYIYIFQTYAKIVHEQYTHNTCFAESDPQKMLHDLQIQARVHVEVVPRTAVVHTFWRSPFTIVQTMTIPVELLIVLTAPLTCSKVSTLIKKSQIKVEQSQHKIYIDFRCTRKCVYL